MNERMRKFVFHMIQTGNAAKSARLAGYAPTYARNTAYRLRRHPEVKAELDRHARQIDEKLAAVVDARVELGLRRRARVEGRAQGRATP